MAKKIHIIREDESCEKCGPVGVMRLGREMMCRTAYLQCNAKQRRVLLERQMVGREYAGVCDLCGDHIGARPAAHLDHDNATGYARGWLCNGCNVGLGYFRDDPSRLAMAIKYLEAASAAYGGQTAAR